jgi:DNA-binding CsgD family transcriptional regulator
MQETSITHPPAHLERLLSGDDAFACLEIIRQSMDCKDNQALSALMRKVGHLIEADFCACLFRSKDPGTDLDRIVILDAFFPAGWLDHYSRRQFHLIDPIIAENFNHFGLQYWNETYQKAPPPSMFLGEAEDAGLKHGFSYGLQDRSGTGGSLFSFAGPRLPSNLRSAAILQQVLPHLHRVLGEIEAGERALTPSVPLSVRELEVLKWTSVGKSSWETGKILRISERTVNFHMRNILVKLDSVNRAQAVAMALKLGLLSLS